MATFFHWSIYCETEEKTYYVWKAATPTACPEDAGHTIRAPVMDGSAAPDSIFLNDGTKVWRVTVDGTGALQAEEQT
jgi:hypothetical protein